MRVAIVIAAVVVALLVVGGVGGMYYVSSLLVTEYEGILSRMQEIDDLQVVEHTSQGGLIHTTFDTQVRMNRGDDPPLAVRMTTDVRHLPIFDAMGLRLGVAQTKVVLDEASTRLLMLREPPTMTLDANVYLGDAADVELKLDPFEVVAESYQIRLPEPLTCAAKVWNDVEYSYQCKLPELTAATPDGRLGLGAATLDSTSGVEAEAINNALKLRTQFVMSDKIAGSLPTGKIEAVRLDAGIRGLSLVSYDKMQRTEVKAPEEVVDHLASWIEDSPELRLEVDELALDTSSGPVVVKLLVQPSGAVAAPSLVQAIGAQLDASAPQSLVKSIVGQFDNGDFMLQMAGQMGFLATEGDLYKLQAELDQGAMTVNGKPVPFTLPF